MGQPALSNEGARSVYALLRLLGASAGTENEFVYHFTNSPKSAPEEWRFGGELGGGGKLYLERDRWRVGCYREDDTPARIEKIALANELLEVLRRQFGGGDAFEAAQSSARRFPRSHSSPCRFCGAMNEGGVARCGRCDRTMWNGSRLEHERRKQSSADEDVVAESEMEELIDEAIRSGETQVAEWSFSRLHALARRASDRNTKHMMDVTFTGATETGRWTVHLRNSRGRS